MKLAAVGIGECMLELTRQDGGGWRLGWGGDTYNTCVYLARLGVPTTYLTAIGVDPFSAEMRDAWEREGIDTSLVLFDEDRMPGLYAIKTDAAGERSFYYWREQSAARRLFELKDVGSKLDACASTELLYISGITLSLVGDEGVERLVALCGEVRRRGGDVAFDPNYRSRGWHSPAAARDAIAKLAPTVTIALPTFEDEAALRGDSDPNCTVDYWLSAGASEVVVKLGSEGCLITAQCGRPSLAPALRVKPVDTTGAGDSFNAAYLAARRKGKDQHEAARLGNVLAARVVQHPGAIIPIEFMPEETD